MLFETTSADKLGAAGSPETSLSPFLITAMLEFEASLQLLAERACFLSAAAGAAIAVSEGERMVYRAASGISVPEPGTSVDLSRETIRACLEKGKANWIEPAAGFAFSLTVPILREANVLGVFELVGHFPFGERQQAAVARLAEMVIVAIEHRSAAFAAERGLPESANSGDLNYPELTPEPAAVPARTASRSIPPSAPCAEKVQTCSSCGFPVSNSRRLCLDCEQNSSGSEPVPLFSSEPEESWLSRHGYFLASILISALVALMVYWLRG